MPLQDDIDLTRMSFETTIELSTFAPIVSASDVAPLMDELNRHYLWVRLSVAATTPPAAGWSEMALVVTVVAPAAMYLKPFLETWAQEDARQLREKLYGFIRQKRSDRNGRHYVPLQVHIGGVRFYFWGTMTDEEFQRRLLAAHALMEQLPDRVLEGSSGPQEYGYFWDVKEGRWRGTAFELRETDDAIYSPSDLFEWMKDRENR